MTTPKPLLVLGATGKQGKKLITTLLASPSKESFTILALTRNPDSASAKALAAKSSNIKLVKGDLDDVPAVFKAALDSTNGEKIWGVFSVLQAVQDGATQVREVKQGKDMVDEAIANDVQGTLCTFQGEVPPAWLHPCAVERFSKAVVPFTTYPTTHI